MPALFFIIPTTFIQAKTIEAPTLSLCESKESIIFSCSLKNKKLLSICTKNAKAEYRFGTNKKLELILPKDKNDQITYNTLMYSGGGGVYVRFKHVNTDYIVFSKLVKGEGESAGVLIQEKGKKSFEIHCSLKSNIDISSLENLRLNKELSDTDPLIEE